MALPRELLTSLMFGSIDIGPYLESSDSLGCVDIYRGGASRKIDVEIEKALLKWPHGLRDMYCTISPKVSA
jgi:hypothetical protein